MERLLRDIRACTHCRDHLPDGPNPVLSAHPDARVAIIGQAPGRRVHASGIPWKDASGDLLRTWLGVDEALFYDPRRVALVPMGFCYPGTGANGDLPPRPECAPLWHDALWRAMPRIGLRLLVGQYAQKAYLGRDRAATLTETVRQGARYGPGILPLPHPSPRNRPWLARNPWFDREVLPDLRRRVQAALA